MTAMLRIGNIALDAPFYQAGLAGYSDAAMRLVARRHGCPYAVTEAMLDLFLNNGGRGLKAAELDPLDHPIAGQLMGSFPGDMARAAKVLVGLGYDVIDVNLACPVKKIRKRSRGGHLMSVPEEAVAILEAVRQAVPPEVPCTVKLRRGSDDSVEAETNFRRIFEAVMGLGYAGATVHGRTVAQKYIGPARWEFLAGLVKEYGLAKATTLPEREVGRLCRGRPGEDGDWGDTSAAQAGDWGMADGSALLCPWPEGDDREAPGGRFVLGGSGDIWTAADIFRMIRETGVHLVSVARGCIGNPWIFTQARALMAGDRVAGERPPTLGQQRLVLLEHFDLSVRTHGEKQAGLMMRKFGIKFASHHPRKQEVARAFIGVKNLADWRSVVEIFYPAAMAVAP